MTQFEVVSFDMFQTLVDVNSRRSHVWSKFLGDAYEEAFVSECWGEANRLVFGYFNKLVGEDNAFYTVKQIFEKCYIDLFPAKNVNFDPLSAARILADEHGKSSIYEDSEIFFNAVKKAYKTCLVSDADKDMILPLLQRFSFDKIYVSEDYKCYKFSENNVMFSEAIKYFGVKPSEIIHIGDGYSDVLGASRAGIVTCWLNRHQLEWNHSVKPDYKVTSLYEAASILDLELPSIA